MKRVTALVLICIMALSLYGCAGDAQTKDNNAQSSAATVDIHPEINLLSNASSEKVATIVRDQLTKAGFVVNLNLAPDYSSASALVSAGNFDLYITGWTTVTGNPDYAVRALFKSDGGNNTVGPFIDAQIDEYIDKAAGQTPEEYVETYSLFEKRLVEENAFIVPLYQDIRMQGFNAEVLNPETVTLSKSRFLGWEKIEFNDTSKNETDPLIVSFANADLPSFDPVKNNGSMNYVSTNTYVRLTNLTPDDRPVSDGSLSYEHVIKEGNESYYFVLRDDINFSKVENMQVVNTGVRVGAEDVVFSLSRAKDKNSAPNHINYSLHENMKNIEIVTDLAELNSPNSNGKPIIEVLQEKTPTPISSLTSDKTKADNKNGVYQVVRIDTIKPFPQVLNYLAHHSGGILCKEQVESINTYKVSEYDANVHISYGDQATFSEGSGYNNTIWASGPYQPIIKNDYQIDFQKNPGYMPNSVYHPRIKNVTVRFISARESAVSALRSGETYIDSWLTEAHYTVVSGDSKLVVQEIPSNSAWYLACNTRQESMTSDINIRKAILHSINQDEIIAVYNNRVYPSYSTVSPLVPTGNVHKYDPNKVAEYLTKYAESLK